ncbi:MAG: RidA family protein [bacterium]|nr:MAG: RidA family protein [bacterium]
MHSRIITILGMLVLVVSCQPQQKPDVPPPVRFLVSEGALDRPFSEAVRVGNMLYLSGQVGIDPSTNELVPGGIKAETEQVLKNIKETLEKYGSSLDRVVKSTVMLSDIRDYADMNAVYIIFFPQNRPARSTFATSGLAFGAQVEIECCAVVD